MANLLNDHLNLSYNTQSPFFMAQLQHVLQELNILHFYIRL